MSHEHGTSVRQSWQLQIRIAISIPNAQNEVKKFSTINNTIFANAYNVEWNTMNI